ncbi:MAG TPA: glycosyltransferase family 4 protein [Terriglobales bacterium]|nr:glycosyltransferase family 4 protein [Terriglobales bacterium]
MRPKVIFLFADDRFFWSHRLSVARAALKAGYEVIVATGVYKYGREIQQEGFRLIPITLTRNNLSPLDELRALYQVRQIYRREKPDIVHHVALKAVLCGSVASLGLNEIPTVNALTGLGYLVASKSQKARLLGLIIWRALRFLLHRDHQAVLVENADDKRLLVRRVGVSPEQISITRGSGVDIDHFQPQPEPSNIPVVVLASRMLWIKGIREFVEAAELLGRKGLKARFVLAGGSDPNNPSCVPPQQLADWQHSGVVEWWGHQQDMLKVFRQANLICLPSHGGEGVPKVLMEAAACGRAVVTTNVPGCRDIIRQGVNGIVVEPRDVPALALAIEELLNDPERRCTMGQESRRIAVGEFSEQSVISETLNLYNKLLEPRSTAPQAVTGRAREA